jgi:hypothetical protein
VEKLVDVGMSIAQFNFSHGDDKGHLACLNRLRTVAANRNKPVGKSSPALFFLQRIIPSRVTATNLLAPTLLCPLALFLLWLMVVLF